MTFLQTTLLIAATCVPGQPAPEQPVDYVRDVKPILAAHCFTCHGAIKQKGSLRLDTIANMTEGGDHGPAFKAGKPDDSLLLKRVLDAKRRMPPESDGEALKPAQVAILRRWIAQGATGPKDEKPEPDPREHWSFKPPTRPAVPKVKNARNPIDAFLAAEYEKHGLRPQGPAERGVLLRRVYIDLIGLPPTREEMQAFLADDSPDAYEKVVDRLLASPQYGERWGRHWMDIWRYSDWWGLGPELRNSQRHIWHWRDWIVESLSKDKGYDQMLREMLAADELYPTDLDALRGTGFLARHYFLFNRTTWLDETIEHTSKAFFGLTMNCCKCHDHKYDAFSQADYYRFRAIFEPYQIRNDMVAGETDVEKNGIPRVYDAHLDAMTFLHIRGNEASPDKNRKIVPNLPALLAPDGLGVKQITLPAEAHQPGLRAHVLQNYLVAAEMQLKTGRDELAKAKALLGKIAKKEALDSYRFTLTSVDDTDKINGAIRDRKLVLELANVVPFASWPKDLTPEERKVRDEGLAFLKKVLAAEEKRILVKGYEKGKTYRGDVTLMHTGQWTPGAPSSLGWFITQFNCMLIEQGYSIYQKDGPELFFDDPDLGMPKKGRDALYKEAEAHAIKNKLGIWKHENLVKKLKALPARAAVSNKADELVRDNFAALDKERWSILGGEWKVDKGKLVQAKVGAVRGVLRLRRDVPTDFEVRFKFATIGGETYRSVGITFDADKDSEALIYLTPHPPARVQVSYKKDGQYVYPADGAQQHPVPLNQTHDVVLRVRGNLLNVSINGKPPLVYRLPIARRPGKLELISYDASASFEEFVLSTLPADVAMSDGGKIDGPLSEKQARSLLQIAEAKIAHAEATIAAVKARAAADRALAENGDSAAKLKLAAALAEKQQTLELAQWNLVRAESGDANLKLSPQQAKAAVDAARKVLQNPGEAYTPLVGAVKTRENNLESDANRMKPFPKESTGRRAALAKWGTDRNNPLTARVAVNHIWARHFGQPLVATVFDFGRKGAAPTHPDLLDWLAVELMEHQWSTKHIHRLLVTSNAYRMTSSSLGAPAKNLQADAENRYYWRMNPQRMESQIVRDSLLHLAGDLDLTRGGPPVLTPQQDASKRRSTYFFHSAIERNKFLMTFDEADPLDCYRRRDSIIPQQALALSNSKLAGAMSDKIAERLAKSVAPKDFASAAFAWILGYEPTANERAACEEALVRWTELNKMRPDAAQRARSQLIQALLNHNDFITVR